MSTVALTLEAFFTDRLINQRQASAHTVAAYRDTFRLLLAFVHERCGTTPSALDLGDLDAALIGAFLDYLEHERHNGVRTRNARLAAVHSFFRFAALSHPEHASLIQRVLAIPTKRGSRTDVSFLDRNEIVALLAAPDQTRWIGRRDYALLVTAIQTGLRVSELTGLCREDVVLEKGAHVRCLGKGRKARCTPLGADTVVVMRRWMDEQGGGPRDPLFPMSRGRPLSRDAIALVVSRHTKTALGTCPSLKHKTVSPHVLRHTTAMTLLQSGNDVAIIAMWLGHESIETSQIYIHADLSIKEALRICAGSEGSGLSVALNKRKAGALQVCWYLTPTDWKNPRGNRPYPHVRDARRLTRREHPGRRESAPRIRHRPLRMSAGRGGLSRVRGAGPGEGSSAD